MKEFTIIYNLHLIYNQMIEALRITAIMGNVYLFLKIWAYQVVLVVKNPPVNAGDAGDTALIPGTGRSPGGEHGNLLHILAWEIPWTEEPGGLKSVGLQCPTVCDPMRCSTPGLPVLHHLPEFVQTHVH